MALVELTSADTVEVPEAQNLTGLIYLKGNNEVSINHPKAVTWSLKAAAKGLDEAQLHLGLMHEKGQGGAKDETQAVALYLKAAGQGNALASYQLGRMYWSGKGV